MFSKITNPYEELKKKKNYSSAFSNPYQKKPSVGISPMPQTTQKNQEVKKTETSTKKIPKLTPITETKKTSTTEVDPTILPTHKDFLKAETRRQLPKAFVSALKNIITPITVVIPEEIKDPEEQIKYILNQRLDKLADIGRGFIARCISLPAEIIALTSKEFEMPKEVRLPFTKRYYPTYSGIYDEAYQAGGSHALATLVTAGMLTSDGLIVSAGLSSLRPQPKGLVTQQQASISRRQDIKVKLTREDIQAITRGPEFAKVDPVKLEAFKTLTREGVNWTKILNATKKINPATGKPYTINEAYKFGLDNLKPGYIKPAEMAKELDIYKGATPQAKATGVSAGVSSSLVAEASKYESSEEFIKEQSLIQEAKKYKSAEEFIKAKQKQADLLKQRFQETKSGNDLRAWKKLQNEIDDYQVDVAKKLDIKRIQEQRIKDNKIRKADATVDKLSKDDLDLLINEAKKVDNLDDFIGKIRGSATQYGEYTPKLRKYVRPESVFMGDIKGLNPNTKITVYRGIDSKSVTGKQIRNGDFVTTDYNDALQYTDSPSKVVSLRTRLKNLVAEYPDEVDISNPLKPVSYELIYNSTGKINKITKSQLIDIWNEANKATPEQSLIQEAKKYKSADEFVKAQGTPVYRGGKKLDISKINEEGLPITYDNKVAEQFARSKNQFAESPAGQIMGYQKGQNVVETYYVSPNAKIANKANIPEEVYNAYKQANPLTKPDVAEPIVVKWAKANGFDAIDFRTLGETSAKEAEIKVINPDILKTKSQLTDIWNKAKGKAKEILKPKEGSIKPSEIGKSLSTDKAGVRASAQAVQAIKPILGGIKAIDPKSPFVEELTNEIAYRVNSKGDLVPAIRQQSGIYAPKEFENFPFKDVGGKDLNNINFAGALDNIVEGKGFGPMMKMMFEHNKLLADRNEFITITSSKISKLLKKYKMLDILGKPKSKDGELVFQMMEGKYPKEAGPFHKKIADELRTELDSLREQANKVRRLVGKEEIGYIENYAPHIQKASFWQDILKSKQTTISDNFDFVIPNRINASYFKKRFGLIKNKETNIFKLLDGYISAISNDIYVSPIIEQLKAVNSVFAGRGMMKANNWINTYIRENLVRKPNTIDNFAGLKAGSPVRKLVGRFIQARNLGALVGNIIWSITTQPASLGFTYMKTGRHMGSGMLKYFVDKNLRNRISNLPSMRIKSGTGIGTTLGGDIDRITSKIYKTKIDNWNDVMGFLGNVLEKFLTGISASAGYSKGIKLGLKGKELDIYADYVAQVTQSMYNAESRPLALNSMLVRLGAPFQTFAFEAWRHANTLGGRTKGIPLNKQQRFWGVMNLLVATFVINYLHKKSRGRKLQTVGSFIPLIGSWVDTQINKLTKDKTQAGRSPIAPLEDFNKMNEAIKSAIDDGDLTKLRKELVFWSLGMSGIGGAGQINRTIDGIIATEKGYVDNVKGERLYDIEGWDKLFAPIVGPYGTKAGMEYLDGFVKTSIETKEEMANRILKEIKDNNLPNDLAKKFLDGELKKREDAFERILLTIPEKDVFAQSLLEYIKNGDVSEKRAKSIIKKYLETYTSEDAEADDERSKFAIYSLAKNEETAISQIVKYAQAIGTDPITAFDLLFKKEKIRKFKNGAIIVHRMDLKESEAFKKEMGATGKLGKEYKLDHTIPLQLGGDNTEGNLRLVTTDDWASFTPVENFLGKKLLDGEIGGTKVLGIRFKGKSKMSLKEAQQLLLDFKEGKITAQEIYDKF